MGRGLRPLLLAVAVCACRPGSQAGLGADQVALGAGMVHANGLVAAAPEGFEARPTENGFVFVETAMVRSPLDFSLELRAELPAMAGARNLASGGKQILYIVRSVHNPGSGGDEHLLTAARPVGGRNIVLRASMQGETEPAFAPAWAALEHATVE